MKFGCSFGIFLNSAHLICRSRDISKCFSGSLRLRDNESRLYTGRLEELLHDPFAGGSGRMTKFEAKVCMGKVLSGKLSCTETGLVVPRATS